MTTAVVQPKTGVDFASDIAVANVQSPQQMAVVQFAQTVRAFPEIILQDVESTAGHTTAHGFIN